MNVACSDGAIWGDFTKSQDLDDPELCDSRERQVARFRRCSDPGGQGSQDWPWIACGRAEGFMRSTRCSRLTSLMAPALVVRGAAVLTTRGTTPRGGIAT